MIYLASPYSNPDPSIVLYRYKAVEEATAWMLANEMWVYSPIVHCHHLAENHALPTDFAFWQAYNYHMMEKADTFAVLQLDGWDKSVGVKGEIEFFCGLYEVEATHVLTLPNLTRVQFYG